MCNLHNVPSLIRPKQACSRVPNKGPPARDGDRVRPR